MCKPDSLVGKLMCNVVYETTMSTSVILKNHTDLTHPSLCRKVTMSSDFLYRYVTKAKCRDPACNSTTSYVVWQYLIFLFRLSNIRTSGRLVS